MNNRLKLSREKIDRIVAMYKDGKSSVQIGEKMTLAPATVINYLKREGVERRPAGASVKVSAYHAEQAYQMRAQGICWKTISRKLGLSAETLAKAIKVRGTRINLDSAPVGKGPRLYTVVVSGHLHQRPTLWTVRAYDHAAAEVIAVAEAGYPEDDLDYWADSVLIGELL